MKIRLFVVLTLFICLIGITGCKSTKEPATQAPTERPAVRVTVPEGYTVYQIANLLEENAVCPGKDFIAAVNSPPEGNGFSASIKNSKERPFLLEGYVFPDTYDFYLNETPESALARFLDNTERKLTAADYVRAKKLGYSIDEIIIIASLIQEESGIAEQDAKVASVIYNRLNSKNFLRLQLDASYEYLDNSVEPYLSGGRVKFNSLYNTYVCRGLPAGPICNPGRSSIDAALYPANTDYYYYRTDKNRNFYFAATLAEHEANGRKAEKADAATG